MVVAPRLTGPDVFKILQNDILNICIFILYPRPGMWGTENYQPSRVSLVSPPNHHR